VGTRYSAVRWGAVLILALAAAGCIGSRAGRVEPGNPYWQERAFPAAADVVYRAALLEARDQGWGLRARDRLRYGGQEFLAVTPGRGPRWEDTLSVAVVATGGGAKVVVRSGLAGGPHRPEIPRFLNALAVRLGEGRP
jgi:hypothetical protein